MSAARVHAARRGRYGLYAGTAKQGRQALANVAVTVALHSVLDRFPGRNAAEMRRERAVNAAECDGMRSRRRTGQAGGVCRYSSLESGSPASSTCRVRRTQAANLCPCRPVAPIVMRCPVTSALPDYALPGYGALPVYGALPGPSGWTRRIRMQVQYDSSGSMIDRKE